MARTALTAAVAEDRAPPSAVFASEAERTWWLGHAAHRLPARWLPDASARAELVVLVRYEALRAGLDAQPVLGPIEVESGFREYAVSQAGARGFMQVMPFWSRTIGDADAARLFDTRANLRYGCAILRHDLDHERGDLVRALARYDGSLGRTDDPRAVLAAATCWGWRTSPDTRLRLARAP